MQNEVERKGKIFFPDFCKLSLRKFREFDETHFRQELFKVKAHYLQFVKSICFQMITLTALSVLCDVSKAAAQNKNAHILQIICGTEPHPVKYRAKKYKVEEKFFSFADFR